ncbi:nucleotidyl transferase AbiEii/AbiGii toxin family protein [Candidatus Roizmanbacteria bacterium]|nr:nucleotidyl transferase AbiEii/AbiGii toxin family protein [Candidatus Roizmanbacteria bacterium]
MGKVTFDPLQQIIVTEFLQSEYLRERFYFTGGTALSIFYFHHRLSEDLDFFSESAFSEETVQQFMSFCAQKYNFKVTVRKPQGVNMLVYQLDFGSKGWLKVDFNHFPYKRIEEGKPTNDLTIDSLRDIGANKLTTIVQRTQVKDFVDLYFLLKEFTIWDLLYGVEVKFKMEYERLMIADDFLKVDEFDTLPKMLVPLTLKELKSFFRKRALEIGRRITQ